MVDEKSIIRLIEKGLPVEAAYPFQQMAESAGLSEESLLSGIASLIDQKKIKRFGIVMNSRALGIDQNAMVTLKIPEERVLEVGEKIAEYEFVTLCYQRATVPGVWEYNLYFMIHGRDRAVVEAQIAKVLSEQNISESLSSVLFSQCCFKQKGASY
jgi:DNA-binding Lrp family transcriptional regulator